MNVKVNFQLKELIIARKVRAFHLCSIQQPLNTHASIGTVETGFVLASVFLLVCVYVYLSLQSEAKKYYAEIMKWGSLRFTVCTFFLSSILDYFYAQRNLNSASDTCVVISFLNKFLIIFHGYLNM